MDREEDTPDNLRNNQEGKKKCCITWEHAEDSFEASNCKTSKVRSKIRNTIARSTTQAKPIDLSQTAHPELRALNLRHKTDVHSRSGTNRSEKCELSVLAAAVQPTPKLYSVL